MSSNRWMNVRLENTTINIIDGDRGINYPKNDEFFEEEYCLFLNTSNVTVTGFNFSKTQFITKEKDSKLRKGKLKRNDIVLTTRGTVGNVVHYVNSIKFENIRINSGMVILRVDEKQRVLSAKYLYCFLKSPWFREQVISYTSGSAQPQLPIKDLKQIELPCPSFDIQCEIVKILSCLDDKIELNRQTNASLEAIAQAIFKEWFLDNKLKLNWEIVPFTDMIDVNPGRTLKKNQVAPYLDMASMPTEGHRLNGCFDRPYGSGTKFINGDTLIAKITPCLENGKTAFVDFLKEGQTGWGSTEYIIFRPKLPMPTEYGYFLARSDEIRNFAIQNMIGTSGRQRTPASCFNLLMIRQPPSELVIQFGDIARSIMAQIKTNSEESQTLAQIRDILLPKLLNGEIEV